MQTESEERQAPTARHRHERLETTARCSGEKNWCRKRRRRRRRWRRRGRRRWWMNRRSLW
ncbi:hypothetical protein Hanom_Chr14g01250751 [Helianthus anomalus]